MDLEARKYHFIEELFSIEDESIIDTLERVLKEEKKEHVSKATKKEIDNRLESYKNNSDDVLDWEDVKTDW